MTFLQPAIPNSPVSGSTPQPYVTAEYAVSYLQSDWGLDATLGNGQMLAASMLLDEEAPFQGVKLDPTQDRQWPRTFKYGWPNIVAAPTPIMVDISFAGAFWLDYEAVVPMQVAAWVCLEAYRLVSLPFDRGIIQESVTGASVHYAPGAGEKGSVESMLDRAQAGLLSPFLVRSGHTQAFIDFAQH